MFMMVDDNGDGLISKEEFVKLLMARDFWSFNLPNIPFINNLNISINRKLMHTTPFSQRKEGPYTQTIKWQEVPYITLAPTLL